MIRPACKQLCSTQNDSGVIVFTVLFRITGTVTITEFTKCNTLNRISLCDRASRHFDIYTEVAVRISKIQRTAETRPEGLKTESSLVILMLRQESLTCNFERRDRSYVLLVREPRPKNVRLY
jgi:hypothetical protein